MTTISSLLSGAVSAGSNLLGGIWGYAGVAAICIGISAYTAENITQHYATVKYQALQLKDAAAVTASLEAQAAALTTVAAEQHALDTETAVGAVSEAQAQAKLDIQTRTIVQEIPTYVPTVVNRLIPCIPYGLIRVLDAAALSANGHPTSAGDLALPAGKSADACAPLDATALAGSIAENYGAAGKNAEQLNALSASIKAEIDKANAK